MSASLRPFLLAAVLCAGPALSASATEEQTTSVTFSDPARPGTLRVQLARGDLRIQGADTTAVTVRSSARATDRQPRKDGLRVLAAASGYTLTEKDNVAVLDGLADGWKSGGADFHLTVPRGTQIVVKTTYGGDIRCTDLSGDLEINSMNGRIRLENVSGGAVVQTMNGEIDARIASLAAGKPLSFTSMNGEVSLRLPASAQANLRLRTQNGSVLTDFPESALVTKTESSPRSSLSHGSRGGVLPPEAKQAIAEATRAAAQAAREIGSAVREAAEAAREAYRDQTTETTPPTPPKPPRPPKVPVMPTLTGGKLLTGTLNGGGPEISVATMNGDVVLRQTDR